MNSCGHILGKTLQWRHNGRDNVSNHQPHDCFSSASLAFVRGIHRGPVNSPHKWPVTGKMFPFDDVIMDYVRLRLIYIWIWEINVHELQPWLTFKPIMSDYEFDIRDWICFWNGKCLPNRHYSCTAVTKKYVLIISTFLHPKHGRSVPICFLGPNNCHVDPLHWQKLGNFTKCFSRMIYLNAFSLVSWYHSDKSHDSQHFENWTMSSCNVSILIKNCLRRQSVPYDFSKISTP